MKWIPISERLPEKNGWYITWKPGYAKDNWDIDRIRDGRFVDRRGITHWLEITGPEDYCEYIYVDDDLDYDDDLYKSECGLVLDHDEFKRYTHCPNCGRPIKEVK